MPGIQFNMPVEQEERYENERASSNLNVSLYKPLPNKAGQRFVNELFIPLFEPSRWSIFNKSTKERVSLGLYDHNPLAPTGAEEPLYTFYFKVPVHTVQDFVREDGSSGFAQLVCPNNFNAYLTKAMGRREFFQDNKCPLCEAAGKAWSDYNARWKEIEEERGIKKSEISSDGRKDIGEKDPILKEAYTRAKKYSVQEKVFLSVFDYGKLSGSRVKDSEDEALTYQVYFAPKTVFDALRDIWVEDNKDKNLHFFNFDNPQGLQVVKLIKNTERCSGKNLRDTSYTVMKGNTVQLEDAWVSYLSSLDSVVDPSDFLNIVSYENMVFYANSDTEENYNQTPEQAVQTPQASPQVPMQAPAPAAPPSPPVASQAASQASPQVPMQAPPMPAPAPVQTPAQAVPQTPAQAPVPVPPQVLVPETPAPQPQVPVPPTATGVLPTAPVNAALTAPTPPAEVPPPPAAIPDNEGTPDRAPSGATPPAQSFNW